MTATARHVGRDQYGTTYWLGSHPRKELLERLGRQRVQKLYSFGMDGEMCHVGYLIAGLWIEVHQIEPLAKQETR